MSHVPLHMALAGCACILLSVCDLSSTAIPGHAAQRHGPVDLHAGQLSFVCTTYLHTLFAHTVATNFAQLLCSYVY